MEEPIVLLDAADMEKFLAEIPDRGRDAWRIGMASVVALAALAGVAIVGPAPVRTVTASENERPAPVVLRLEHRNRLMGERVSELEESNRRLYAAIEGVHLKLAEVEVIRATMEDTAFAPREPERTETADARVQ